MSFVDVLQNTYLGRILLTIAVSMLPVLELRAAIPFGVAAGLGPIQAMLASIVGNMLPVPFIILFVRRVFAWLRNMSPKLEGLVCRLEARAEGKWEKVHRYERLGLMILVAIPLPGTGAWTGALIAALVNMSLKHSIPPIFAGVVIAGLLITGLTFGFTAII